MRQGPSPRAGRHQPAAPGAQPKTRRSCSRRFWRGHLRLRNALGPRQAAPSPAAAGRAAGMTSPPNSKGVRIRHCDRHWDAATPRPRWPPRSGPRHTWLRLCPPRAARSSPGGGAECVPCRKPRASAPPVQAMVGRGGLEPRFWSSSPSRSSASRGLAGGGWIYLQNDLRTNIVTPTCRDWPSFP